MEDRDIMELLKADENKFMKSVMEKYAGLIFHIVKSRISNTSDVEDIVSEVFIELYKNRNSIDLERGTLKALLSTIAVRRSIDHLRRKKDTVELEEHLVFEGSHILDELIEKEEKNVLLNILNLLKEPDRSLIIGRYFFKTTSKELGRKLDIEPNAVDKRISRAMEKLRDLWKEENHEQG